MPSLFSDSTRAKELLGHHHKPLTAVTDWIDRICDPNKACDDRDLNTFIIELVETINLQPTGPQEASRAIRKQLKHGRPSQQAKSINILEALVLNGGDRFRSTFADARLVECLKSILADFRSDVLLRRRILLMLSDWERLYGSDPRLIVPSSLFKSCGGQDRLDRISTSISSSSSSSSSSKPKDSSSNPNPPSSALQSSILTGVNRPSLSQSQANSTCPLALSETTSKHQTKEMKKKKRRLKSSSIDQRYRTELTLSDPQSLLKFDINKERPRILQTLATASQTANNLVNRLQLCDPNQIATDPILQALVEKAKVSQKGLVRYIQTVSDHDPEGEYLGTLLNTNAQVLAALDLFNDLIQSKVEGRQIDQLADRLKKVSLSGQPSDVEEEFDIFNDSNRSEERPIAIVSPQSPSADLLGLEFGTTSLSKSGGDQLQVPLVPDPAGASTLQTPSSYDPGTLSDFSDFEDDEGSSNCSSPNDSSETTTSPSHLTTPPTNNPFHKYLNDPSFGGDRTKPANANQSLDPFADPFLDPSSTTGR